VRPVRQISDAAHRQNFAIHHTRHRPHAIGQRLVDELVEIGGDGGANFDPQAAASDGVCPLECPHEAGGLPGGGARSCDRLFC
jgi:hypothetical protein